ncbi:MAG: tetratricopeptide repeat protein [Bacteroidetes bacterium]|nr:tetratricopeptide repeat protein [Bacteroidota bacterium]
MKKYFLNLFFFLSVILIFGCKSSHTATQTSHDNTKEKLPLSYGELLKLDRSFTDGLIQKMQGNYPEAIDKFKKCLDVYPNHSASMYEIAYINNNLGKSAEAIPYAQKAVSLEGGNEWYQMLLAKCFMEAGKYSNASDVFEQLVKTNPEKVDYYFLWSSALLHANKVKEALAVYDRIEEKVGVTEDICLQKERIYLSQNQFDKAVGEAQKLINAFPAEMNYYRMLAELYFQNKKLKEGLDVCKQIFNIDPNDPQTHLMIADYYENNNENEKAFSHVKIAFLNPDLDIDDKIKILIAYFNIPQKFSSEKSESDTLISILLKVHPHDAKTYSMQGDFFNRDGKNTQARDAFRKAIELDKSRYPIWQQVLVLDETLGDFESMETDSRQTIELFPSEPYPYIFNASSYYQKKNYKQAIDVVNIGKDYVAGDKKLLAQFYSILGDCYNATKEYKLSDDNYEKAINLDPENANVMNNWSYFLSLRNEKLDKAERIGLKANQLVKDNASYEDTYAWVLYKQKNYEEAKKWLEKAIQHGGDKNGVIMEHLGDVLFQMGQVDSAFEYWQKAKVAGKHSEFLDRKISDKKMYE